MIARLATGIVGALAFSVGVVLVLAVHAGQAPTLVPLLLVAGFLLAVAGGTAMTWAVA